MSTFRSPRRALARLAALAGALLLVSGGGVASADPSFATAHLVTGLAALNADGGATIDALSCFSSGNCGAIGTYTDSSRLIQGFVVNETGGTWGSAIPIPGLITLNADGIVGDLLSISCTAANACTAGGYYTDASQTRQAFVVDEVQGAWNSAIELPRSGSLPVNLPAELTALDCTSPGACVAGGYYLDGTQQATQSWVATESGGAWSGAVPLPGAGTLNVGVLGALISLTCPAAGDCQATGLYTDSLNKIQGYVASESNGTWAPATAVPGLVSLNTGGFAGANQIVCSSVGRCAIGGFYSLTGGAAEAFVADEVGGVWGSALELPGSGTLNTGGNAGVNAIDCPSDGSCEAVGGYADNPTSQQAFVASETNGVWGNTLEMPGTAELNGGDGAQAASVSCVSTGDCRAVGQYTDSSNNSQAFVDAESGGVWGVAAEAPGSASLNVEGVAELGVVSCTSDGACSTGGQFKDASGFFQAMILDASLPPATAPGAPSAHIASHAKGKVTITVTPGSTGGSPITGYQYSIDSGAWRDTPGGATTFTLGHEKVGTKIRVRVRALNSVGTSAPSASVSVKVR